MPQHLRAPSRAIAVGLVVLLTALATGCEGLTSAISGAPTFVSATIERDFAVSASPELVVESGRGAINVETGEAGKIAVSAKKGAATQATLDRIEVGLKQEGDRVTLTYAPPEKAGLDMPKVDFTVRVPASARVTLHSSFGDVSLKGLASGGSAQADNGIVTSTNVAGVQILKATAVGSVKVIGAEGTIRAETGNGPIDVEGKLSGESWERSGNGNVTVKLAPDADLKVSASGASLQNEFGWTAPDGKQVQGTIGAGSKGSLDLTSGTGTVKILKK